MNNPIPTTDVLSRLWVGRCTISEYKKVTDPVTHQSTTKPVVTYKDEPCRLSYSSDTTTNANSGIATVAQIVTLFVRPNIIIPAGSVIEVTQHGRTSKFKLSGKPAVYTNHQEVVVTLDEDV